MVMSSGKYRGEGWETTGALEDELKKIIERNLVKVLDYDPFRNFPGISSTQEFMNLFRSDPAFAPFCLNREKYITARFGGNLITSLHRKLGDIYEEMIQTILSDRLNIPIEDLSHSLVISIGGQSQERSTDGRILLSKIDNAELRYSLKSYISEDRYLGWVWKYVPAIRLETQKEFRQIGIWL